MYRFGIRVIIPWSTAALSDAADPNPIVKTLLVEVFGSILVLFKPIIMSW